MENYNLKQYTVQCTQQKFCNWNLKLTDNSIQPCYPCYIKQNEIQRNRSNSYTLHVNTTFCNTVLKCKNKRIPKNQFYVLVTRRTTQACHRLNSYSYTLEVKVSQVLKFLVEDEKSPGAKQKTAMDQTA